MEQRRESNPSNLLGFSPLEDGTQGKVERFHGALERALQMRPVLRQQPQAWLEEFRWERNYVRPYEALGMRTPATVWHKSERSFDSHPPRWNIPREPKC